MFMVPEGITRETYGRYTPCHLAYKKSGHLRNMAGSDIMGNFTFRVMLLFKSNSNND